MTNRERIVATLRCEPTDRPPMFGWLGLVGWGQTMDRWRDESGIADLDLAIYFDYDRGFLQAPVELGPYPRFDHEVIEETEETITYRDWRGVTMQNRRDGNTLPSYLANPVSNREEWERYRAQRLSGDLAGRITKLDEFARTVESTDAPVQVGGFPFGCFGTPRDVLGVEPLLLTCYDDPGLLHEVIETFGSIWLAVYEAVAARVHIDHIHIWEDMSGKQGSLISIAMVEQFMMDVYDRIDEFCRARGVAAFSVDSDGHVAELVEVMSKHGVNSFFPFEVQAGNDIIEYRKQYPAMSLWGGLDKRALAADRRAVNRELARAEELFALGGYIVGFDHAIPPDVPWKNFEYFVTELKKIVGKGSV